VSRTWPGAVGLALVAVLLTACGAGGFGSTGHSEPDLAVHSYVALGDGFTAAPYVGAQADEACRRSTENYPSLVADKLHLDDFRDVSCTGATSRAITHASKPGKGKDKVAAQIEALHRNTDLVSIGAGIEDRDLLQHIFEVCTALPCGTKVVPQETLKDIAQVGEELASAVRAAQDAAPDAYIVLVGYPHLAPAEGSCTELPELDQSGLDAANYLLDDINGEIRSVARQTGAGFVDVSALSQGHELCSDEPWVKGRTSKVGESVAYHPVAAEQRAVADALIAQVRSR
jgi:hypothetical protein